MSSTPDLPAKAEFRTTRWSVVIRAGRTETPSSREAIETLCQTYWYPLYAYVRRTGTDAHEAQDLTQEFFARFLAKGYLAGLEREGGKFRSYLLGALKHFLANEWDKQQAKKRGGGQAVLSLDVEEAETRYRKEPAHDASAEKLFEKQWAVALLDRVLERLREESAKEEKVAVYAALKPFLAGDPGESSYREAGAPVGLSEGAFKVAVHRLRRRYRQLLKEEIAHTVADPGEVDDEIRQLFQALGS